MARVRVSYFTFGSGQRHVLEFPDGTVLAFWDKTIVKVTAPDPRAIMFAFFGAEWSFEYDEKKGPEVISRWGYEVIEIAPLAAPVPS